MSLKNHLLRLNITESNLQNIIKMADQGLSLGQIHEKHIDGLSAKQIYAILARYCREDGNGSIDLQYPEVHNEFISGKDDEKLERSKIQHKNKKILTDTYDDLKLKEAENSDISQL